MKTAFQYAIGPTVAALVYLGFLGGYPGAANVATFYIWLMAAAALLAVSTSKPIYSGKSARLICWGRGFGACTTALLAWGGAFATAAALVFAMVTVAAKRQSQEDSTHA